MTLALKWGDDNQSNSGFVYLDAVTLYSQNYKGQTTKHPIDAGGLITDHFIRDNPTFTIGAVITGVDISTGTYLIRDLNNNTPYNASQAPTAVSVNSTDQSTLSKLIPDSFGQFISDQTPTVVMDSAKNNLLNQIRDTLISLVSGEIIDETTGQFISNVQLLKIYEYDGITLNRVINRIVMTNVIFKEDPNTGYGLYCDFNFEQVTFASLVKAQVPKYITSALAKKASPTVKKSSADSTSLPVPATTSDSKVPIQEDLNSISSAQ